MFLKARAVTLAATLLAILGLWPASALSQTPQSVLISHVDTADLPEVRVFLSVVEGEGQPVQGLDRSNFGITEDGSPQDLLEVARATESAAVVLALDTGGSMGQGVAGRRPIDDALGSAESFVNALRESAGGSRSPADQMALMTFDERPALRQALTRDYDAMVGALRGLRAGEKATALYDAAYEAVKLASGVRQGPRAVLLFTGSRDEGRGGQPGSAMTFDDVVGLAVQSGVPVHILGLGSQINSQELARLANLTGGRFYRETDSARLRPLFDRIATQIKTQYRLRFKTNGAATDHFLQVRVSRGGSEAIDTRKVHYPSVPPVVSLLSPREGAEILGVVEFVPVFNPYLQRPIVKTEFWIGSKLAGTSSTPPFSFRWDAFGVDPGKYGVEIKAYDLGGQVGSHKGSITVSPANTAPKPGVPMSEATTLPERLIIGFAVTPLLGVSVLLVLAGVALSVVLYRRRRGLVHRLEGTAAIPTPFEPSVGEGGAVGGPGDRLPAPAPRAQEGLATLTVVRGSGQLHRQFLVRNRALIGRAPSCDVVLEDPTRTVSRRHAALVWEGNSFFVYDVGSVNGTRVDGLRVRPDHGLPIGDGQEITLAHRYVLKFTVLP